MFEIDEGKSINKLRSNFDLKIKSFNLILFHELKLSNELI